jgi:hypothetical protein
MLDNSERKEVGVISGVKEGSFLDKRIGKKGGRL